MGVRTFGGLNVFSHPGGWIVFKHQFANSTGYFICTHAGFGYILVVYAMMYILPGVEVNFYHSHEEGGEGWDCSMQCRLTFSNQPPLVEMAAPL